MKKIRGEKPQRGNKHQITYFQHVIPAGSIKRFCDFRGGVQLHDKNRKISRFARPDDEFQNLVDKIIHAGLRRLNEDHFKVINKYFSLLHFRAEFKYLHQNEIQLPALGGTSYSIDDEELLEKSGIGFVRAGAKMPTRFIVGTQIYIYIIRDILNLKRINWSVIEAHIGEFIMPDFLTHATLPITSKLCIAESDSSGFVAPEVVSILNKNMADDSREFYFARDISKTFL